MPPSTHGLGAGVLHFRPPRASPGLPRPRGGPSMRGPVTTPSPDALSPHFTYTERRATAEAELKRLDALSARYANLRAVVFTGGAAVALAVMFGRLPKTGWWAAGAALVAYIVLAVMHHQVFLREERQRQYVQLNARGLARLTRGWHDFAERGERFLVGSHLYAADLDVFGQGSVFQLMNETATRAGEERLAGGLSRAAGGGPGRARGGGGGGGGGGPRDGSAPGRVRGGARGGQGEGGPGPLHPMGGEWPLAHGHPLGPLRRGGAAHPHPVALRPGPARRRAPPPLVAPSPRPARGGGADAAGAPGPGGADERGRAGVRALCPRLRARGARTLRAPRAAPGAVGHAARDARARVRPVEALQLPVLLRGVQTAPVPPGGPPVHLVGRARPVRAGALARAAWRPGARLVRGARGAGGPVVPGGARA